MTHTFGNDFVSPAGTERHEDYYRNRDALLGAHHLRGSAGGTPWGREAATAARAARVNTGRVRGGVAFRANVLSQFSPLIGIGATMEDSRDLLRAVNQEVLQSKDILEKLVNEVRALGDIVNPALLQQATALRDARMTVVRELHESLTALRDVRKFFLESDYTVEMDRLRAFVKVCREIQELKAAGVFDAVCDAALRLAVPEPR